VDKKIKVFVSCLLIGIPVIMGVASFFVHHAPQSENLLRPKTHKQTNAAVPTVALHPTPTMYIFPKGLQAEKLAALIALDLQASAKGIVIENPKLSISLTPPPVSPQAGSSARLLQSKTGSAVIIDNPSSSIIN
jgi:hypothetical protein